MPAAMNYYPPTDEKRGNLQAAVVDEHQKRSDRYRTALKYFLGEQPEQLEVEDDELDPNTVINMVKMTGERTASFLFPDLPKFKVDPKAIKDTPEEIWIQELLEENGGLTMLQKWALRGFLSGHTFIRVKPKTPYPSIIILDPMAVTCFWKADDVSDIFWYCNHYWAGATEYLQDYVRQDNGNWKIYTYESAQKQPDYMNQYPTNQRAHTGVISFYSSLSSWGAGWKLIDTATHKSNAGLPPIIDCPHLPHPDDYYGLGEADQTALQDDINRLASQINRITSENSDPVDVLTGAQIDEVGDKGKLIVVENPAGKVTRLEMKSDLTAMTALLQQRIETLLSVCRVVLLKGEAKDLQRVTNAAVRTLFLDALAKNKVLQSAYGRALTMVVRLAVQMSDLPNNHKEFKPKLIWGSPLPIDLTEIANINAIMDAIGAQSKQTSSTNIGNNWSFEKEAMEVEHTEAMARQEEQMKMQAAYAPEPAVPGKPGAPKPAGKNDQKQESQKALTNKKPGS